MALSRTEIFKEYAKQRAEEEREKENFQEGYPKYAIRKILSEAKTNDIKISKEKIQE